MDDMLVDDILGESGSLPEKELRVIETVPRRDLFEAQTPQVFGLNLLKRGYDLIAKGGLDPAGITDDASLVEALGRTVRLVAGESTNLKLTRPEDLELAEAITAGRDAASAQALGARRLFGDDEDD